MEHFDHKTLSEERLEYPGIDGKKVRNVKMGLSEMGCDSVVQDLVQCCVWEELVQRFVWKIRSESTTAVA
jgi:hypothetical protein